MALIGSRSTVDRADDGRFLDDRVVGKTIRQGVAAAQDRKLRPPRTYPRRMRPSCLASTDRRLDAG